MTWKKLGKALLFPPLPLALALTPISAVLVARSLLRLETTSILAILSYVLAAYTLTVWCARAPRLARWLRVFRQSNKLARRWREDERLRANILLFGALLWNAAYALLQLWLGLVHASFWFFSLAGYYLLLALMRFFLVRHTLSHAPGERLREELVKHRACGWVFLIMNLALSLMVFFMVYWNRTFVHDEITTITMAAYTFAAFALAIVSIVRYRRHPSPILAAARAINLAAASVSVLTLESTMLNTFGADTTDGLFRHLMLGLTGAAVVAFVIVLAILMIVKSNKKLKMIEDHSHGAFK